MSGRQVIIVFRTYASPLCALLRLQASPESDGTSHLLMQYLRALYSDLTAVIENHEAFTRLLRSARGGGGRDDGSTGVAANNNNQLVGEWVAVEGEGR